MAQTSCERYRKQHMVLPHLHSQWSVLITIYEDGEREKCSNIYGGHKEIIAPINPLIRLTHFRIVID